MRKTFRILLFSTAFLACACNKDLSQVTSINIIDRNGMSETISSKDRLAAFEKTDFLTPQPYQKVLRVYGRSENGDVKARVTSYHPNGQVKQYLEAVNNRAHGNYKEWYPNGQLKVEAYVINGVADLNTQAEESWLFDGQSLAWDEEGNLLAKISYDKGALEGMAQYFHPNGKIWKLSPYHQNALNGTQKTFLPDGTIFQTTDYKEGAKEGTSVRYWDLSHIAYHEKYVKGELREAAYYDTEGHTLSTIKNGNGKRAIFGKASLERFEEFKGGVQAGAVQVFDESGHVISSYSIIDGEKQGEEIDYFPGTTTPKLLLTWTSGILQGTVKSWYESGQLESQREMSQNKKNGLLSAWYTNGALMLLEEYDNDNLIKGEYYRMGEKEPVSKIEKGNGLATLFSSDGTFSHKVFYEDGKPLD